MLARRIRLRPSAARQLRLTRINTRNRHYNDQPKTYFQGPPASKPARRLRIVGAVLWTATAFALGTYAYRWAADSPLDLNRFSEEEAEQMACDLFRGGTQDVQAREGSPKTLEEATELLEFRSGCAITPTTIAHFSQLPSNMPCEDAFNCGVYNLNEDRTKNWDQWSIFDGHAGPRTAHLLKHVLPSVVGGTLWNSKCMDLPYVPNDRRIIDCIKKAFLQLDRDIVVDIGKRLQNGGPLTEMVSCGAIAFSGSCALLALYDPAQSVLRVANVGDSRAVLGRWDASKSAYVAQAMSVDQTGFNEDEVARLARDHPDEDVVDPKTGRVHGMAVSRAFGDARWKWPQSLTRFAHDKFWGPSPRPDSMIKTPPYLTAEPEVMEARVQAGDHPDFLIMASDGLWDQMSSEDAVICVNEWLKKNKPADFVVGQVDQPLNLVDVLSRNQSSQSPSIKDPTESSADEDTYYDEDERCLKWRVSPKHFVVEDDNCGVHLIKNALGGKRRNLFTGVMSVQPPLSRSVRDDITVNVIFFGQDPEDAVKYKRALLHSHKS